MLENVPNFIQSLKMIICFKQTHIVKEELSEDAFSYFDKPLRMLIPILGLEPWLYKRSYRSL